MDGLGGRRLANSSRKLKSHVFRGAVQSGNSILMNPQNPFMAIPIEPPLNMHFEDAGSLIRGVVGTLPLICQCMLYRGHECTRIARSFLYRKVKFANKSNLKVAIMLAALVASLAGCASGQLHYKPYNDSA